MRTEVHILGHHYIVKVHGQECLLPIILRPLWVDSDFLGYHISDIYADFITIAQRVLPITLLLLVFIATSFWYALRGTARLVDPVRVSGWFRPPSQPVLAPTGMYACILYPKPPTCIQKKRTKP